jgi:hypothetical protein
MRLQIICILFILLVSCGSHTNKIVLSDVPEFKYSTDTIQHLLERLSEGNHIYNILIVDGSAELSIDSTNLHKIHVKMNTPLHSTIWNDSYNIEDIDSIENLSNAEFDFLKKSIYVLCSKHKIELITSRISHADTRNSIFFELKNKSGDYYSVRYMSFLKKDILESSWFKGQYKIYDEKHGLYLFGFK